MYSYGLDLWKMSKIVVPRKVKVLQFRFIVCIEKNAFCGSLSVLLE